VKKIYSGEGLAVVVLNTDDEIALVRLALKRGLERMTFGTYTNEARGLLAEMEAPAPA
jgi:hypothetical protein